MLRRLLTFEKDIVVINHPNPYQLVELLFAQASDRRTKLAIQALLDFFKDDRDALTNGHYKVVVTENLIKGCTYNVFAYTAV
jgi:hypothetical protein